MLRQDNNNVLQMGLRHRSFNEVCIIPVVLRSTRTPKLSN